MTKTTFHQFIQKVIKDAEKLGYVNDFNDGAILSSMAFLTEELSNEDLKDKLNDLFEEWANKLI